MGSPSNPREAQEAFLRCHKRSTSCTQQKNPSAPLGAKCARDPPFEFSLLLGLVPGTTFCLVITIEEGTRNVCGKPKPNGAAAASRRNFDAKPKKSPRQFSYSRWRAVRGR